MKILQVNLFAEDLIALEKFYGSVLGMKCHFHENLLTIDVGESKLCFDQSNYAELPYYHFAFNIPSNKVEESLLLLEKKISLIYLEDYHSYIADFSNWNAKSIYFPDPAGNIVELIARRDLDDNPIAPFSMQMVRNISEIGIVFPEHYFETGVDRLLMTHQLTYFPKQQPLPHFRVIGDDEGLLICVSQGRDWYPLKGKPAMNFPMQVKIQGKDHATILKY